MNNILFDNLVDNSYYNFNQFELYNIIEDVLDSVFLDSDNILRNSIYEYNGYYFFIGNDHLSNYLDFEYKLDDEIYRSRSIFTDKLNNNIFLFDHGKRWWCDKLLSNIILPYDDNGNATIIHNRLLMIEPEIVRMDDTTRMIYVNSYKIVAKMKK